MKGPPHRPRREQHNANSPAAQAPHLLLRGRATSQNAQSAPANNRQDTTTGQSARTRMPAMPSDRRHNPASPIIEIGYNATTAPSQTQSAQRGFFLAGTDQHAAGNNQNQPAANSANNANPNTNAAPANQPATSGQHDPAVLFQCQRLGQSKRQPAHPYQRVDHALEPKPVTNVNSRCRLQRRAEDVHFQRFRPILSRSCRSTVGITSLWSATTSYRRTIDLKIVDVLPARADRPHRRPPRNRLRRLLHRARAVFRIMTAR